MNLFFKIPSMHDAAICFIKNQQLSYLKLERFFQKKHFGAQNLDFQNCFDKIVKNLDSNFKFYNNNNVDHHHRHALSIDFFEEVPCDIHIVIDGEGNKKWFSIFRENWKLNNIYINSHKRFIFYRIFIYIKFLF